MRKRGALLALLGVAVAAGAAFLWESFRREHRAEVEILGAAERYGVEPALVKAVVWQESRFRAGARGRAGELGLMQVGPLAAKEWAEAEQIRGFDHGQLIAPGSNVLAGTWYLARLLRRYGSTDHPAVFALADYNAGRANVLRWIRGSAATNGSAFLAAMDFPTTRHYVQSVLARREKYRGAFPRVEP